MMQKLLRQKKKRERWTILSENLTKLAQTDRTSASGRPHFSRTHENTKVVFWLNKAIDWKYSAGHSGGGHAE